jgi:hypothetical protein
MTKYLRHRLLAKGFDEIANALGKESELLPWNGDRDQWILICVVPENMVDLVKGSKRKGWPSHIRQCVLGLPLQRPTLPTSTAEGE